MPPSKKSSKSSSSKSSKSSSSKSSSPKSSTKEKIPVKEESLKTAGDSPTKTNEPQKSNQTFIQWVNDLLFNPPKPGVFDDAILLFIAMLVQFPFYFLYALVTGVSTNKSKGILENLGDAFVFMIIIDLILIATFWLSKLIMYLFDKLAKSHVYLNAGISLFLIYLTQGWLWLSNTLRKSKQPSFFYVQKEIKKRTVFDIFKNGLWLSFLSILIPFQVFTALTPNPASLSISNPSIIPFVIWIIIMAFFFVAVDILHRSDIRYYDEDDAIMQRISSLIQPVIGLILGGVIAWFFITNLERLTLEYTFLGFALLTTVLIFIVQVQQNHEMEIESLINWIREDFEQREIKF